jgi:DNA-binding transcriptional LysR family regulator
MIDLRRLHVFRAVATHRSFSAAASALNYTQSSVSQHVTNLERELGVTLLDRGARPVRPTEAGEIVLDHAEDLLGRAAAIERELAGLAGGEAGTLHIGGFFTAWATFMPAAGAAYSRRRPRVQLDLRQLEPVPAVRALRAADLDLAVIYRYEDDRLDDERVSWTRLLEDPYAIALPAGHPLAATDDFALSDLAEESWVSPPSSAPYTRMLRRLCSEHGGFDPRVVFETNDIAMAQPLVASGLAVSLMPALGLRPLHEGIVVRAVPDVPPARYVDVGHLTGRRSPAADAMVEALRAAAVSFG